MTLIGFVRHAATAWNAEHRLQGRTDVPLSAEGIAAFEGLEPPAALAGALWFASPLLRARETARLLGIAEPRIEPLLVEMDFGAWEGRSLAELRAADPEGMQARERAGRLLHPPGGERPAEVIARLERFLAERGGEAPALGAVTHLGVIRAAFALSEGWDMVGPLPFRIGFASAHLFRLEAGRLQLEAANVPLARRSAP